MIKFFASLSVVLLLVGFNSINVFADEGDGFSYDKINGDSEIKITGLGFHTGDVTIPSKIEGLPVTTISEGVFKYNTDITSVSMPSITTIEPPIEGIFFGCDNLISVDMPKVTEISENTFFHCRNLTSVNMPKVTEIGESAFSGCTSLANVNMPKVTEIGLSAFFDCGSLTNIDIPKVEIIRDGAFENTGLTSVVIPSRITTLGYDAFSRCSDLESITVLSKTVVIDHRFEGCSRLSKIYCYDGSAAQQYARSKGIEFELLTPNHSHKSSHKHHASHEHNFVWARITEPTEYRDGTEGYVCTTCGATRDTVSIPYARVFMEKRCKEVIDAKDGETLVLEMGPWHSLSKEIMEEIAKKRNTTFIIQFTYNEKNYEVVVPEGQPLTLDSACEWYGPLKLDQMFGMKEVNLNLE